MSVVAREEGEPVSMTVLSPGEAMRRARPLPSDQDLILDGLTDEEWIAFIEALAER